MIRRAREKMYIRDGRLDAEKGYKEKGLTRRVRESKLCAWR